MNEYQKQKGREYIAKLLVLTRGIHYPEAEDIVNETRWAIAEEFYGDGYYENPAECLQDFLGLSEEYLAIFR